MPTKAKRKVSKPKNVAVTHQFLMNLANSIYDSKNRKFLRLCNGTLQNGPDPTNKNRPMHCGLGELYYAMTGRQPEETGVSESDVVDLAVELSPLPVLREKAKRAACEKLDEAADVIKELGLPRDLEQSLLDNILDAQDDAEDDVDGDHNDIETSFREALDDIPDRNDDGIDENVCSLDNYKDRSKRVAAQLRLAARLLPR